MKDLKKEIVEFIKINPTADITVHTADDKSYGLVCLTLFNFTVKLPQQIIIGEYDSDITDCININSNPDNIIAAVDMFIRLTENKQIIKVYMNE